MPYRFDYVKSPIYWAKSPSDLIGMRLYFPWEYKEITGGLEDWDTDHRGLAEIIDASGTRHSPSFKVVFMHLTGEPIVCIDFDRLKGMANFTRRHMNDNTQPLYDDEATNREMDSFRNNPAKSEPVCLLPNSYKFNL